MLVNAHATHTRPAWEDVRQPADGCQGNVRICRWSSRPLPLPPRATQHSDGRHYPLLVPLEAFELLQAVRRQLAG